VSPSSLVSLAAVALILLVSAVFSPLPSAQCFDISLSTLMEEVRKIGEAIARGDASAKATEAKMLQRLEQLRRDLAKLHPIWCEPPNTEAARPRVY
jgi:hypothetical protein